MVFSRPATEDELKLADDYLKLSADTGQATPNSADENAKTGDDQAVGKPAQNADKLDPWERFAQALLITNEFVYVD